MKFKEVIGIDIGKLTNDAVIHSCKNALHFENSKKGFNELINWIDDNTICPLSQVVFAFEHTGIYSLPLALFLSNLGINYIMIPGLEIKRSLGIQRGKDDQIDAHRIAQYTYWRKDEITPYKIPSQEFLRMRRLLSLRERMVKQRAGYEGTLKENKRFLLKTENLILFSAHEKLISELNKQILKVEKELLKIVSNDEQLKKQYELIISIKGVGAKTALFIITLTNGFTLFENHRAFASYAGIAPFPFRSGISINGRTKVSNLANKKMKALLSSCATSAIMHNSEMRLYYARRIKEGKHKMSTINIVRNKMLARIFAVVKRGTPYVDTLKYTS